MKTQSVTVTSRHHDPVVERMIQKRDADLNEQAGSNGRDFAHRNLPPAKGDKLIHYVGQFVAGYKKLEAEALSYLQPHSHFPEGKMDLDASKERDAAIDTEIQEKTDQNLNDLRDLGKFDPRSFFLRLRAAIITFFIMIIGEILFNAKAFQVMGENLLAALILSISVSFTIYITSHIAVFLYKAAKSKLQRWLIVIVTLLIVTGSFAALASMRSMYLSSHDIYVNPIYFIILNLLFFITSAVFSFSVLPTLEEMKRDGGRLKLHRTIQKRTEEIKQLKTLKHQEKDTINESSKFRVRDIHYAEYTVDLIRKMRDEAIANFKNNNMMYRLDRLTPECFSDIVIADDDEDSILNLNNHNRKPL